MTELFTDTVLNMMTTTAEPEDYTGEDGLLYCGKCRTAKEDVYKRQNEVRPIFRSLGDIAQATGCAIVLIGHLINA